MKPLRSGYRATSMVGGPECESLERELEAYYSVPYARVFNSGTSALHAAVAVTPWDTFYVPAYSMSASAACVLHAGRRLKFTDIADDYCAVPEGDYPHVIVHLFGHHATRLPANQVIHDCAQSPSVRPDMARYGDIWVYSLNQSKVIDCGEGGYALTFDKDIATRLHAVRNHGDVWTSDILGYNLRMTEMQAAIARTEFRVLDRRLIERQRWAARIRLEHDLPDDPSNVDWFLYPIRCKPEHRQALADRVGGRIGYHLPIPDLPYYKSRNYQTPEHTRLVESELVVVDPAESGL